MYRGTAAPAFDVSGALERAATGTALQVGCGEAKGGIKPLLEILVAAAQAAAVAWRYTVYREPGRHCYAQREGRTAVLPSDIQGLGRREEHYRLDQRGIWETQGQEPDG